MANPIAGTYTVNSAISFKDCFVEVDVNAEADWADIDSWATEIQVSGEDVPTTETYPFEGVPIVFSGNKSPVEIRCTIVYTEGTDDPFYVIRQRFEDNDGPDMDIRFAPKGSGVGNLIYTSTGGKLIAAPPPVGAGDANSATQSTFVIRASSLTSAFMA